MKKLKVRKKLSVFMAILLIMLDIAAIVAIIHYLMITNDLSLKLTAGICVLAGFLVFLIYAFFNNSDIVEEYVTEMVLTPQTITLVYRHGIKNRLEVIPSEDIESVSAELFANNAESGKSKYIECSTDVEILKKNGEKILFSEKPNGGFLLCEYTFLLKLISLSKYLPNFKYKVTGDCEFAKEDIRLYELNEKRMSFWKRAKYSTNLNAICEKIALIICLTPAIALFVFFLYTYLSSFNFSLGK